ncbi:hypothetical protein EGM92_23270, partial [Enterobacter cloacae]
MPGEPNRPCPGSAISVTGESTSSLPLATDVQQQGQTLTITAEDEHAGLRLTSELALDASGVLVVRH